MSGTSDRIWHQQIAVKNRSVQGRELRLRPVVTKLHNMEPGNRATQEPCHDSIRDFLIFRIPDRFLE